MTPEQFCYWLQGFGELTPAPPTPEWWQAIQEYLATTVNKVAPPVPGQMEFAQRLRDESNAHAAEKRQAYWGNPGRIVDNQAVTK